MVNTDKSQEAGLVAHILRVFEAKKDTGAQTAASAEEAGKPEKLTSYYVNLSNNKRIIA